MVTRLALLLQIVTLSLDVVCNACFDGGFRAAVRVGRTDRAMFRDGNHVWKARCVAIDSGGGREDDIGHIVFGHGGKKADGAVDIGTVIL